MGYTTDFTGSFTLDKPLTPEHRAYLEAFAGTRRMARKVSKTEKFPDPVRIAAGLPIGPQGAYFVGADAVEDPASQPSFGSFRGQKHTSDILDYNRPPQGQPGLWCQWVPSEEGEEAAIEWDGNEKFYDYIAWIKYLIDHFLKPWGYVLNGCVDWQGEESDDMGRIEITDNVVKTGKAIVTYDMED